MFYNVENLFDTYDDPDKNDNEFLPDGIMRGTTGRYYRHLRKTAQVISAIGEWGTPAVCGLCEVENDTVLVHLLNRTPLKEQHYSYSITTGNDPRGINNALLYQRDKFKYLGHSSERIPFADKRKRSRDILHVRGELINGERLDIFVCHFPSRSGGEKETESDRLDAARFLRKLCDSVHKTNNNANILVMGDFNDNPYDKNIQVILKGSETRYNLINLFGDPKKLNFHGTHKFQGEWSQLDQMMISRNWNNYLKEDSPRIFAPDFLLTKKNNRGEQSPLRKYAGKIYKGGYSDHLPIVADFLLPFVDSESRWRYQK
jgi:endonuclease/exonuclease/phosphatase family metal-dependent hydrolase